MKKSPLPLLICILSVYFVVLAACSCGGLTPSTLAPSEEAAVYSVVIHQIYLEDDTCGGKFLAPTTYIVRYTDDRAGDHRINDAQSVLLTKSMQTDITAALSDLPTEVVWVDSFDNVERAGLGGGVINGGAIITLGNIYERKDGSIQVAGSIYMALLGAGGQTYVLQIIDGLWSITGNEGTIWIS